MKRRFASKSRKPVAKKPQALRVTWSIQDQDEEWKSIPCGIAFKNEGGRIRVILHPLAAWQHEAEVSLTIFTEPYDGSSEDEEEDE